MLLDHGIDTSTAVGRMFFQILDAIAEFEHALMSERTIDGLAAARARGRTGGQKPKLTPRQARFARQMYEETGPDGRRLHTVAQIAAEFGVTRPTIYRHLDNLPAETPAAEQAAVELAARLAHLPADSRPGPPSVDAYDQLLPRRTAARSDRTP